MTHFPEGATLHYFPLLARDASIGGGKMSTPGKAEVEID